MREIKFRAWIHDAPHRMESMFYQENQYLASFIRRIHMFYGVKDHPSYLPFQLEERLQQHTGLKDKNGKEIYEGDVVCFVTDEVVETIGGYDRTEPEGHLGKVEFTNGAFWVNGKEYEFYQYGEQMFVWDELEIIGNIYENPELLK